MSLDEGCRDRELLLSECSRILNTPMSDDMDERLEKLRETETLLYNKPIDVLRGVAAEMQNVCKEENQLITDNSLELDRVDIPEFPEIDDLERRYREMCNSVTAQSRQIEAKLNGQKLVAELRALVEKLQVGFEEEYQVREKLVERGEHVLEGLQTLEETANPEDLRPKYRQLRELKAAFEQVSMSGLCDRSARVQEVCQAGNRLITEFGLEQRKLEDPNFSRVEDLRRRYENTCGAYFSGKKASGVRDIFDSISSKIEHDYDSRDKLFRDCDRIVEEKDSDCSSFAELRTKLSRLHESRTATERGQLDEWKTEIERVSERGNVQIEELGLSQPHMVVPDFSRFDELLRRFLALMPGVERRFAELEAELGRESFLVMFRARLSGSNEVYSLPIKRDADVETACRLFRSELGVKNPLAAVFGGTRLDPDARLFEIIKEAEDILDFVPVGNEEISYALQPVSLESAPQGQFRLFSSLTVASMTTGDLIEVGEDMDAREVRSAVETFLRAKYSEIYSKLTGDVEHHVYLPGAVPFVVGTIRIFGETFPTFSRHLYAIVTRPIPAEIMRLRIEEVVNMNDPKMELLLSPLYESSRIGLSIVACFLGYIHNGGPLHEELIYSLSKVVPFAPLISSLHLIDQQENIYGYFIPQVTAALHTLLMEAFSCPDNPSTVFEHLLEYLPFLVLNRFNGKIQCSIIGQPYLPIAQEKYFADYLSDAYPILALLDSDLRGIDAVQLGYECDEKHLLSSESQIPVFRPVSILVASAESSVFHSTADGNDSTSCCSCSNSRSPGSTSNRATIDWASRGM
jgi:hypothetical protein